MMCDQRCSKADGHMARHEPRHAEQSSGLRLKDAHTLKSPSSASKMLSRSEPLSPLSSSRIAMSLRRLHHGQHYYDKVRDCTHREGQRETQREITVRLGLSQSELTCKVQVKMACRANADQGTAVRHATTTHVASPEMGWARWWEGAGLTWRLSCSRGRRACP